MEENENAEKFVYDDAFQNRMFLACGVTTFHLFSLIFFIQRMSIGLSRCGYRYQIQDHKTLNRKNRGVFASQIFIRFMLLNISTLVVFTILGQTIASPTTPGGPNLGA